MKILSISLLSLFLLFACSYSNESNDEKVEEKLYEYTLIKDEEMYHCFPSEKGVMSDKDIEGLDTTKTYEISTVLFSKDDDICRLFN